MHYILPIKGRAGAELGTYVRWLTTQLPVIVVDGSDTETFAANAIAFAGARHLAPSEHVTSLNGKVAGVRTAFIQCPLGPVVIADDDVRYGRHELDRMAALLSDVDVVVPQNYYAPMTWAARADTARILVNRAFPSGDYPGTLGVRLTERLQTFGYDGDVLFENLELIRTVRADGGRVRVAPDLYVRRLPPTTAHYLGQRVRQAYDSLGQPGRLVAELAVLPLGVRYPRSVCAVAITLAEAGRRRSAGRAYFPAGAVLLAPVWLVERAVCSWIALAQRLLLGGTTYSGRRIKVAAHSVGRLRMRRACACRRRTA